MSLPSRRLASCLLVSIALASFALGRPAGASPSPADSPANDVQAGIVQGMVGLAQTGLRALVAEKSLPINTSTSPFSPALVQSVLSLDFRPSLTNIRVNMGPPLAEAADYLVTRNSTDLSSIERDVDILLNAASLPNGGITSTPSGPDIDTMFFADDLGMLVTILGPALPADYQTRWTAAVAHAADFLVTNGNLRWYTNGNIVIGNALTMALAWKLTSDPAYEADYETALAFAANPPQNRWTGSGLIITKQPTAPDGSDGAGYFTEMGPNGPGYDGAYAQVQDDQLARLFLVTGDPRVLRQLNLVTNQLLSFTDTSTWFVNSGNGTRHDYPHDPMLVSGIVVLAYDGGRSDLLPLVGTQSAFAEESIREGLASQIPLGDGLYYTLGLVPVDEVYALTRDVSAPAAAPTSTSISMQPTFEGTHVVRLSGTIVAASSAQLPSKLRLELWASAAGSPTFARVRTVVASSSGQVVATVKPARTTQYRWQFAGLPAQLAPATSPVTNVTVLSKPTLHASRWHGSTTFQLWAAVHAASKAQAHLEISVGRTFHPAALHLKVTRQTAAADSPLIYSGRLHLARHHTYRLRLLVRPYNGLLVYSRPVSVSVH